MKTSAALLFACIISTLAPAARADVGAGGGVLVGHVSSYRPGNLLLEAHGTLRYRWSERWYAQGEAGALRWTYSFDQFVSSDGIAPSSLTQIDVTALGGWLRPAIGFDPWKHVTVRAIGTLGVASTNLTSSSCTGGATSAIYGVGAAAAVHFLQRLELGAEASMVVLPQLGCRNPSLGGGGPTRPPDGPPVVRKSDEANILIALSAGYVFD